MNDWDNERLHLKQIERRLGELGSIVKGQQSFHADRLSDLVEQIEELRKELSRVAERQDKMAEWIKANVKIERKRDG